MTVGILNSVRGKLVDMVQPVSMHSPLNRDLYAWYVGIPGTQGSSRLMDITNPGPNGRHGTLNGMELNLDWVASARPGSFGALDLDGAGTEWIDNTNFNINGISQASIMCWVRTDTAQSGKYIVSVPENSASASGFDFHTGGGTLICTLDTSVSLTNKTLTVVFSDNVWRCLAATYDGANFRFFADGVEVGTASAVTGTLTANSASQEINIGRFGTLGEYFDGEVDDVRVWTRALTPLELTGAYHDSLQGYKDTLSWIDHTYSAAAAAGVTADAGAFAVTGNAATLKFTMPVDTGSFVVTGSAATMSVTTLLTADAGSFAVTGSAATTTYAPVGGMLFRHPGMAGQMQDLLGGMRG